MRNLPLSLWLLVAAQIEAQQLLPTAIRKMPADEGAKFHHEYCAFPEHHHMADFTGNQDQNQGQRFSLDSPAAAQAARRWAPDDGVLGDTGATGNASLLLSYRSPISPHFDYSEADSLLPEKRDDAGGWNLFRRSRDALARLQRRQWSCPTGTKNCASIGFPNSCCETDETCVEITDTGLGRVGCCPAGATCGGTISGCADGNTACASEIGGGCCIPGFVCEGVGCVRSSSSSSSPPASSTPPPGGGGGGATTITSTSTRVIETGASPSTVLVTVIVTITPSQSNPPPSTSTITQTSTASTPTTGTGGSTGDVGAPVRPTNSPGNGNGNGTPSDYCPTGFYPCLARAGGGCCQTGRDCQTTSCPPAPVMRTIVNDNGITVVVPASGAPGPVTTGRCATGWFLCGGQGEAGCCPSGYSCGTASCSVVVSGQGTATVAKERPANTGTSGAIGGYGKGRGAVLGSIVVMAGVIGLCGWVL